MRAFIAVDVPPPDPRQFPELRPEDHITLHFFAELPEERVAAVVGAMRDVAGGSEGFDLEIRGVGAFPSADRPRVVWAGVGTGATPLHAVVDRLRAALSTRGFAVEGRTFVPHLTVLRLRSREQSAWARQFLHDASNVSRVWTRTRVTEILLKESELLPTGARHTVRARVALGTPDPGPSVS